MSRKLLGLLAILLVGAAFAPSAVADSTVGFLVFTPDSASTAEFDIINVTGVNAGSGPDANYITSEVDLTDLSLAVTLAGGTVQDFGSSYFTLSSDGISFNGTAESSFVGATAATLTGEFVEPTITLLDGTVVTINDSFSSTISDAGGLSSSDFALITASASGGSGPPIIPEPESLVLTGTGLMALAGSRRRMLLAAARRFSGSVAGALAITSVLLVVPASMQASAPLDQVKLTASAAPSTGLAGFNNSTLTGSGFPSGAINASAVTITFSSTCGGAAAATTTPISVSPFVATTDHALFAIPGSLSAGTYYLSISGTSVGGVAFVSSNCSQLAVTATTATLAACVPTSSLAVTVGTNVNAYVPFGYWEDSISTGIEEVPLEGTGVAQNFATSSGVNSCAANSVTGEVVCTENNANVDLINGSTLTTITSGSNSFASFSGGDCENCGVGINASNNTAIIGMGLAGSPSGSGVQFLNLGNNTFNTAFPLNDVVSEDVSIDSGRNLVLSPGEGGSYDLLQIGAGNSLTEYSNGVGGELDSAAEDCTTGIALASYEFSDDIYITDLTQAKFSTSPANTWSAPGQFIDLNDDGYAAGTCGISSAPGTGHLAVVTGEFGGQAYSALLLPSTSGSGTPTLADHAYVGTMPPLPNGASFDAGFDPHTVTAYTSPNSGKSYAVFADYGPGYPDYLGVVDLACVLSLSRTPGTNLVIGNAATCTRYVAVP